jgi:hypothetical protein
MCCCLPRDMYDIVIIGDGPAAFAAAFLVREVQGRVAIVLPGTPLTEDLRTAMSPYDIMLIEGHALRDGDHYLDVNGRLLYGEHIIDTADDHATADATLAAVSQCCRAGLPFRI